MVYKIKYIALILLLTITFLNACTSPSPVIGDGSLTTIRNEIAKIDSIYLSIPAQVDITAGDQLFIEIRAEKNILPAILIDVSANQLRITSDASLQPTQPIEIIVQMPGVKNLDLTGNGSIRLPSTIADTIRMKVRGSGQILALSLRSAELFIDLYGPGKIEISGETKTQYIEIADGGKYITPSLSSEEAFISLGGSGDLIVRVSKQLNATMGGSGNLEYYGDPQISGKVTGTARIQRLGP